MNPNPKPSRVRLKRNSKAWRDLVAQVFHRDGYTCQIDGRLYPENELAPHHIIPVSRGGPDSIDNLITVAGKNHIVLAHQMWRMTAMQASRYNAAVDRIRAA